MANTTFNGPVRSENGFEQISIASGTGAVTTNLDIDSSGNITTTGYVSAYDNVVSIEDATYSVESTQSGAVFTLNRAAGIVVTLPTAAAGLHYTFIVGTTFMGRGRSIRTTPVTFILVSHKFLIQQRLGTPTPLFQTPVMTIRLTSVRQHKAG